jgi:HK97 family phage portal protein
MSSEGDVRAPLFGTSEWGNGFVIRDLEDGWNRNLDISGSEARYIPAVYASVMASSRAVSQCRAQHIKLDNEGKRVIKKDSYQARLLRTPNRYESWNQFILNNIAQMLFDGESFNYLVRDDRGKIIQMHRLNHGTCTPHITPEGDLFYSVGSNPMVAKGIEALIPDRDILHLRSHTPRHPLIGESPIKAAAMAAGINVTLSKSQMAFFNNMSRASGVISTDQVLNKDQMVMLRAAWDNQSKGMAQGKVPVLGGGLKFQQMSITSQDAQLIEAQKLSISDIARVFGVPLPVIGELENSTMNNVQELISLWLSMSLGSVIENVEASLNRMFDFGPNEEINLDESALLRMDFLSRIDGLTKAVQGGVYTINESRAKEGLHAVENGDVPMLQAQMQPIGTPEPEPEPIPAPVISEDDRKTIYLDNIRKTVQC